MPGDYDYDSQQVKHNLSPLTLDGTVVVLGVTFDAKMTFEKHLPSVFRAAARRLGFMRKTCRVSHDRSLKPRYFWIFLLPVLQYCSAVWFSAANSHLKLRDRVVRSAAYLASGVLECNLLIDCL